MRLRAEKIKTMIVTTDRDFKASATQQLNYCAFPGEKFTVETLDDAKRTLHFDKGIENILIDGRSFPGKALIDFLKDFWADLDKERPFAIMVALDPDEQAGFLKPLQGAFKKFHFRFQPLEKRFFIEDYHQAPVLGGGSAAAAKQPPMDAEAKKRNATFFETSFHVRDTITHINSVAADLTKVNEFIEVGNRFNGIFGAFAFVKEKDGYWQLHDLSVMIDTVTRTYQLEPKPVVEKIHFDFVVEAAKCAYLVLKNLREEQPVGDVLTAQTNQVKKKFEAFGDLKRRESKSQDEVDALLDDLIKAS